MDNKPKDIHLTNAQTLRLIALALDCELDEKTGNADEEKSDFLYDILADPLPLDKHKIDKLPPSLAAIAAQLQSLTGPSIKIHLTSRETPLEILRTIKNYAKRSGRSAHSQLEQDVFLAVYFTAIAAALSFHNQKISQHTTQHLKRFFADYAGQSWIPPDIASIFSDAIDKLSPPD